MFSFENIWQQATKLPTHLHWQRHEGWVCSNNRLCSASHKLLNELYVCFEWQSFSFILLSNPTFFVSLENRNKATRYLCLTLLFTYILRSFRCRNPINLYFEYNFQDWIILVCILQIIVFYQVYGSIFFKKAACWLYLHIARAFEKN